MTDLRTRPHADPGLQPERTVLSWTRTVVSLMLVSAVLLRWSAHFPAFIIVVIIAMAVLAGTIYLTQKRRYRRTGSGVAAERMEPGVGSILLMTAAMFLFGLAGLTLLVLAGVGGA